MLTVFPTCVGVFLRRHLRRYKDHRLPHVRGGVSVKYFFELFSTLSSPRAWGCFRSSVPTRYISGVFPTCVGVFLLRLHEFEPFSRLPHVRGGVSRIPAEMAVVYSSSPRAWGCFSTVPVPPRYSMVFPTCVGVFLTPLRRRRQSPGLPHVRGGVSDLMH